MWGYNYFRWCWQRFIIYDLLLEIGDFNKFTKPRTFGKKKEKRDILDSLKALFEGRKMIFNVFKSKLFTLQLIGCTDDLGMLARVVPVSESKVLHPTSFKIISPKQML